ncbi:TetR/AcrR family transcriptional regulator [Streptomyces sp. B3I8]|uniref:TetR/AcrR family transcriptional regulator n=1 Tax=Streptomyces sp. B3I8 TaxID=3042303 RepID=UPI00278A8176|nr:TetR/AcrR family transcriptional regulator [Streptomyces sp. B3I8]MDQ0790388.1 AcrR family transcriptional regulator [Streptomyces sp. B3I8]
MSTVDWTAWRPQTAETGAEGLRERKKRLLRQRLSDTATEMFLERGFDDVRVSEIARACEVSEKTVFNHFPTKESLILDRGEATGAALRAGLAETERRPVEATVEILAAELRALTSWLAAQDDPRDAAARIRRFGALTRSTPSLRAYHQDMTDRLVAVAAEALARRGGGTHDGRAGDPSHDAGFSRGSPHGPEVRPEVQIAAIALVGLWSVQFRSLARHLADDTCAPDRLHDAVTADVRRAADLLDTGLAALDGTLADPIATPVATPVAESAAETRAGTARATPRTPVRPTVENMPR